VRRDFVSGSGDFAHEAGQLPRYPSEYEKRGFDIVFIKQTENSLRVCSGSQFAPVPRSWGYDARKIVHAEPIFDIDTQGIPHTPSFLRDFAGYRAAIGM
jgi:hypothetical protein